MCATRGDEFRRLKRITALGAAFIPDAHHRIPFNPGVKRDLYHYHPPLLSLLSIGGGDPFNSFLDIPWLDRWEGEWDFDISQVAREGLVEGVHPGAIEANQIVKIVVLFA